MAAQHPHRNLGKWLHPPKRAKAITLPAKTPKLSDTITALRTRGALKAAPRGAKG